MTIQVDSRITEAVETDGVSKRFDFNFPLFKGDDDQGLEVRFVNELGYDVVDREAYSLVVGLENKGGHVLFHVAPEAGLNLVIAGKTPLDQSLDITNPGKFFAQSVERSLDKITSMIQEFVSTLDEETRQRINNDKDLKERLDIRFAELAASIDQRFQGKWTEMSDYLNSLLPMFFCIMRKEIEAFTNEQLPAIIDQRFNEVIEEVRADAQLSIDEMVDDLTTQTNQALSASSNATSLLNNVTSELNEKVPQIDSALSKAEIAANAIAVSGNVFDTPEAGVDPVTGVQVGDYFNVRSSNDESYIDEYQNVGGVPTPSGKSYPSKGARWSVSQVFDGSRSQEEININTVDFSYFLDPNKTITFNANNGEITTQLQALKTLIQPYTKIKFPYGDFTVSDEVNFTQDGIWLDGENTRITQTGTNKKIFKSTGTKGFRVSGFELIGKGTEYGGVSTSYNGVAAVFLDSCENARIYDNTIRNFAGGGIRWTGYAIGHRIINNDITGIGAGGGIVSGDNFSDFGIGSIASTNDQDILIQGNNISKHCFGIGLSKGAGCQIIANTIHDILGQHGTYLSNPSLITVIGNRLRNIALEGIKIQLASSGIVSDDLLVSANIINNTGGSGVLLSSTGVVSGSFFNNLVVTNNKIKNAGSYGINIASVKELICKENSVDGAGAYGVFINEAYGEFSRNTVKRAQWAGVYASITDDLHFSDNHIEDVVLNAVGETGQARNYYYVQISKNANATGTPKLFYSDNKLIKKSSNPSEFEGSAGRSLRVTTGIDVYHTGVNYNLTGKAMQLTDLFLKAYDIGISPNVDTSVTGNLNPLTPIYGDGRRRLYSTQDPVAAGMSDTFRIGDRVYHAQPTAFIGWVLTASGWRTFGSVTISSSATYDPPSLAASGTAGDSATTTVPLTGAAVGNIVQAAFSQYNAGVEINAVVSSLNTVTVKFKNTTAAPIDLPSGILTVKLV